MLDPEDKKNRIRIRIPLNVRKCEIWSRFVGASVILSESIKKLYLRDEFSNTTQGRSYVLFRGKGHRRLRPGRGHVTSHLNLIESALYTAFLYI